MTMKLKCLVLLGLTWLTFQAHAEQSVVIDAQSLGQLPDNTKPNPDSVAPAPAPVAISPESTLAPKIEQNLKDEQNLKNVRISPRQKAEFIKAELLASNKKEGEAFLLANKVKPGVVTLPSGVQYKISRPSKGKLPGDKSTIVCRYKGTLIDGTSFDKSDAKKPLSLAVAGLVPGLREAIKLMPTGSKSQIVIPPQLGFGERGSQGVGPNAVLIYDVEIISVK